MTDIGKDAAPTTLLDRSDSRVSHATGVAGSIRAFLDRVRSGDLGSLPVIVGLVTIWTVFTSLNPVFLSSNNLVNLLFDCSTVRSEEHTSELQSLMRISYAVFCLKKKKKKH